MCNPHAMCKPTKCKARVSAVLQACGWPREHRGGQWGPSSCHHLRPPGCPQGGQTYLEQVHRRTYTHTHIHTNMHHTHLYIIHIHTHTLYIHIYYIHVSHKLIYATLTCIIDTYTHPYTHSHVLSNLFMTFVLPSFISAFLSSLARFMRGRMTLAGEARTAVGPRVTLVGAWRAVWSARWLDSPHPPRTARP